VNDYKLKYLEDGLLVSAGGPWAWFRLRSRSYDVLSDGERVAALYQEARLLTGLGEAEAHLLVVPRTLSVSAWAAELDRATPRPGPGWRPHLDRVVAHLHDQRFRRREVYLGISLARRARRSWLLSLLTGPERPMGLEDPRPGDLADLRRQLDLVYREVAAASPGARPATAAELRWLVRRTVWRGLLDDVEVQEPPARPAWGGEALALVEGLVRNGYRSLRVGDDSTGIGHVAALGMAYMPERLPFPGGEWLYHYERLGFPVEASVRFRVVGPRQSASDLRAQTARQLDQYAHVVQTSADVPLDVLEGYDETRQLERRVQREQLPLLYCWPRLLVAGASEEDLLGRLTDLIEAYRDLGIELVRPSGDQLALFLEAMPGDHVRVRAYEQRMEPVTLAGSMYAASAELGDGEGPYLGPTTVGSRSMVALDVLAAARRNRPTGISLTGDPGSGKTNTASKLVHDGRLRGAWAVVIAHKEEDVLGLSRLPGMAPVQMIRPDDRYEGLLDPFRIEEEGEAAGLLAADLCRTFLPPVLGAEAEAHLLTAASAELDEAGTGRQPSLLGMLDQLEGSVYEVAREAAAALRAIAAKPMARMCFGGSGQSLRLEGALTILLLDRLGLPDSGVRPEEWTISERLAVGLVRAMTALVGQLLLSADRHQPKLLFLDEAWAVTSSADGRRLVERIARIGRARNLALLLATQNASDLRAGDPANTAITNSLTVRLGFRSNDEDEIRAMLALVGAEATPELIADVSGFRPGECLMRDLDGRVGRVQVDLITEELLAAFDTTPHADREKEVASHAHV
jgi:AAA-like domain